ncbi:MAG: VIT domain-containing protein, partial [Planctomycetota bacterium]|nr:VIT domain-containing protein [Planctomycetota bacterium]
FRLGSTRTNFYAGERRDRLRSPRLAGANDGEAPEDLDDLLAGGADELWIIERSATRGEPSRTDDTPGSGALVTRRPDSSELVPVPLEHTDVRGRISGYIATVDVRQSFHNPFDTKIEASYVFPLPHDAAVTDFVMVIGERKIRGIIRERQEAQRIYDAARSRGHVASLLTQERPNIFTQKVANIEPGKRIDIEIRYFHTLRYVDGGYEFVFPMVVGPRFNPPGTTDGVGAVARGARGSSGQSTEVSYLRPTERSGHDISLTVEIDAGVKIEKLECPSHVILREEVDPEERDDSIARVRLSPLDTIPNRDFVLRYRVAGRSIKAKALTHRDERGGFFTLMIYPPEDLAGLDREPTELIFVLDCSGSMKGWPLAKAKQAAERALKGLRPGDTFQIIRFSSSASQLGPAPVPASRRNVERGLAYLRSLNSSGGTHMIEGIKAALDFPHDSERLRVVSFLTDGYIGNERQIFQAIHERLGSARIFSFGVGNSVNRHLLEGMARLGRGAAAFVGTDESAARVVDLFYERVNHPALSGVEIDWGGLAVSDVFPKRLPDLLVGRPIVLTGRFEGSGKHVVRIRGRAASAEREIAIELDLGSAERHAGIASVWARRTIQVLSESLSRGRGADELPAEIRRVALEHNLVSAYTAFVAVDSLTRTTGDHGIEIPVAVPVPTGVRYDTTVGK